MVADFLREAGTLQVAHDQVTSFLLAENYQVTSFLLVENDQVVSDREDHVRVASILREEKDKVISILPADHDRVTNFLKVQHTCQRIVHALPNTKNRFKILQSLYSQNPLASPRNLTLHIDHIMAMNSTVDPVGLYQVAHPRPVVHPSPEAHHRPAAHPPPPVVNLDLRHLVDFQ